MCPRVNVDSRPDTSPVNIDRYSCTDDVEGEEGNSCFDLNGSPISLLCLTALTFLKLSKKVLGASSLSSEPQHESMRAC